MFLKSFKLGTKQRYPKTNHPDVELTNLHIANQLSLLGQYQKALDQSQKAFGTYITTVNLRDNQEKYHNYFF